MGAGGSRGGHTGGRQVGSQVGSGLSGAPPLPGRREVGHAFVPSERLVFLPQGDLGPFNPGLPVDVPLWLAINLKQRQKCRLVPPEWMDVGEDGVDTVPASRWRRWGVLPSAPLTTNGPELMVPDSPLGGCCPLLLMLC